MQVMSEQLAAAVRSARQRHGHSYAQAAATIGVRSASVVQKWENGGDVSAKNMPALADYMDVSIEHLGALARGEHPPGRTDDDINEALQRITRAMERMTQKQIDLDARLQEQSQRISELERAMIEALRRRL